MKCITIWQPWATLIMIGAKRIETRWWSTDHRGTLMIHASVKATRVQIELCHEEPFRSALRAANIERWQSLPLGAALGVVELVDVRRIASSCIPTAGGFSEHHDDSCADGCMPLPDEPEASFGNYEAGRFGWLLERPRPFFKPVPMPGRQGMFNVRPESIGFAWSSR